MTGQETKLERVAKVIGDEAYRKLLEGLGGRRVTVPAKAGPNHYLTAIIGQEAADKLCDEFNNDRFDLPVGQKKRALVVQALAKGEPKTKIAATLLVSERYVYKVQAEEADTKDHEPPKQMGLF